MSKQIPASVRREVATRYGLRPGCSLVIQCHYCEVETLSYWPLGSRGKASYWPMFGRGFALDHVRPQARGGLHEARNLVVSCTPCNSRKRDRLLPVRVPEVFRYYYRNAAHTSTGEIPQGNGMEGIGREWKGEERTRLRSVVSVVTSSCSRYVRNARAVQQEREQR